MSSSSVGYLPAPVCVLADAEILSTKSEAPELKEHKEANTFHVLSH
jgi:hypothetical protein